jgi:hypothetical protein
MVLNRMENQPPGDNPAKPGDQPAPARPEAADVQFESRPSPEFVARVAKLFQRCEGCYDSVNWDDNGHGISIGMAQWNQKRGEMPDLLERWAQADPRKFNAIFGPYAAKLCDEHYVREITITRGSDLANRLEKALKEPAFQTVQANMINEKVVRAVRLSREHGHDSELFVAQVADIANQMGWGGVRSALRRSKAAEIDDELAAVKALQKAVRHKRVNSAVRDARLIAEFSDTRGFDGQIVRAAAEPAEPAEPTKPPGGASRKATASGG